MSDPRLISVVMPTYNRRDRLASALDALGRQQVDTGFELVVVCDGSTDGTDDYLQDVIMNVPLRVFRQENAGPAAARNRGVAEATGQLLVFVDDDVVATDGFLQRHLDAHRAAGHNLVAIGPMVDPPDFDMQPWVRWEQKMLRRQYTALDAGAYTASARQFYTGNASVRREHVVAVGGFDTTFRRAEDVELAYRLADHGLTFAYVAEAIGYHYADRSFSSWRSAAYTYGRNDVIFARDRGQGWIYEFMADKFAAHQPLLRAVIRACVRSQAVRSIADAMFRLSALASDRAGLESVTMAAYSAIYGIELHAGIADELGGSRQFADLLRRRATA